MSQPFVNLVEQSVPNDIPDPDHDLARHLSAFRPVTDCPIRDDGRITLFDDAMPALRAMWQAMENARRSIDLEFYTLEDIGIDGRTLADVLSRRLEAGVQVTIVYDAVGSGGTPDEFFDGLLRKGAAIMPFRSTNPLRKHFSWRLNDRDHRKILVVDGIIAFIGGVNLASTYLNPRGNALPPDWDTKKAFWQDAAIALTGRAVGDARALFLDTWNRHGGDARPDPTLSSGPAADPNPAPDRAAAAGERVCIEGSAPHEGRPLHLRALEAALAVARSRVWIASGYFIPMPAEIRVLVETSRRGVEINLVLPGVSDVPGVVNAARATYGKLLEAGIRIHEFHAGVLHAKVSTIDGVWTSIGSSNLDRRSAVLNNEVDAVIFGTETANAVETMLRAWFSGARPVTLDKWRSRSLREHAFELAALGWKRLM